MDSSSINLPAGFVLDDNSQQPQKSSVNLPDGFVLDAQPQGITDQQLQQTRAANDARPWWRKILGLGPADDAMTPEAKAAEDKFWHDQQARLEDALAENFKARADVPV